MPGHQKSAARADVNTQDGPAVKWNFFIQPGRRMWVFRRGRFSAVHRARVLSKLPAVKQRFLSGSKAMLNTASSWRQSTGATLTITGRIDGDNLCVDIADTGPGIDPEHIENIFEAFFTTKGKKGTGLGLAIVKGIVEAHDGELTVANRPAGGAVFTVGLPMGDRR